MTGPENQKVWSVAAIYVISFVLLIFFLLLDVACLLAAKSLFG